MRVVNQETGAITPVYEGTETSCRLPSDLAVEPGQLAFRVQARPEKSPGAPLTNLLSQLLIPRLGDDLDTPADDLLIGEPQDDTLYYRLIIRTANSQRRLVDMRSRDHRFLLPVGQLKGLSTEWVILPNRFGVKPTGEGWQPVTAEMIAAAEARAKQLVMPTSAADLVVGVSDATHPPGAVADAGQLAGTLGHRLLVAVPATFDPVVAERPDPDSIAAAQWIDDAGQGLLASVAEGLERRSLRGVFFLDILAVDLVGEAAIRRTAKALSARGHHLGVLINPAPWRALSVDATATPEVSVARAHALFSDLVGQAPDVAMFGSGALSLSGLIACHGLGLKSVVTRFAEQKVLPQWMRWRTAPYAAFKDLVMIPTATVLSTPAHEKDRVVRHDFGNADAMSAASAADILRASSIGSQGDDLFVAVVEPLALLGRLPSRGVDQAEAWNAAVRRDHPAWEDAGWVRDPEGFDVVEGLNEIRVAMLDSLLDGLAGGGVPPITGQDAFSAEARLAWGAAPSRPYDPVVVHRRGPRRNGRAAIRRNTNALRLAAAVGAPPSGPRLDVVARLTDAMRDLTVEANHRVLVTGDEAMEVARWVKRRFKTEDLVVAGAGKAPPRSRLTATDQTLAQLSAKGEAFDLVIAAGVIEQDGMAASVAACRQIADLLAPGGQAVLNLSTFAAPSPEPQAQPHDALLFPEAAATGEMGGYHLRHTALPATAWRLMLKASGLTIVSETAQAASRLPPGAEDRLSLLDPDELAAADLTVVVQRTKAAR